MYYNDEFGRSMTKHHSKGKLSDKGHSKNNYLIKKKKNPDYGTDM